MTEITTPFEAAVEMQRKTIEQSQDLLQQGLELQQNAVEAFVYNGISAQRSVQRQGVGLMQQLFNAQLDAAESALDDDEVRSALDRQFQQNAETTQELMNAGFEQGAEVTQQLFNAQLDAAESALHDDEFRAAFDSQFEDFEDTQQHAWDEFESAFGETFAELSERQRELVTEAVDAALSAHQQAEDDTVGSVRQSETVAEDDHEVDAAVAETTEEQLAKDARASENGTQHDHGEQLEDIPGLGEPYADQLRDSGIQSVGELADADTETVAAAADISEDHAYDWVSKAQSQA